MFKFCSILPPGHLAYLFRFGSRDSFHIIRGMTKYYFMIIHTDYLQRGRATVSQFLCLSGEQLVRYWNCIKRDEMGPPTPPT